MLKKVPYDRIGSLFNFYTEQLQTQLLIAANLAAVS